MTEVSCNERQILVGTVLEKKIIRSALEDLFGSILFFFYYSQQARILSNFLYTRLSNSSSQ